MNRFIKDRRRRGFRSLYITAVLFLLAAALFCAAVTDLSESSVGRRRASLDAALRRSITRCYAAEGAYPESLEYIKSRYGLSYDETLFYVDYNVQGSNILPDFTIITLR